MGVSEQNIEIQSRCFSNPNNVSLEQLHLEYRRRCRKPKLTQDLAPAIFTRPIPNIKFSNPKHILQRWNERVGTNITSSHQLQQLIMRLYQLHRIEFFKPNIGLIDSDILFYYRLDENYQLIIFTFLGRISLNPLLDEYELFSAHQIKMNINMEVVQENYIPVLPNQQVVFSVGKCRYCFEEYTVEGERYLIVKNLISGYQSFLSLDKLFRMTKHKTVKGKLKRCSNTQKHILRCYLKLLLLDLKHQSSSQEKKIAPIKIKEKFDPWNHYHFEKRQIVVGEIIKIKGNHIYAEIEKGINALLICNFAHQFRIGQVISGKVIKFNSKQKQLRVAVREIFERSLA